MIPSLLTALVIAALPFCQTLAPSDQEIKIQTREKEILSYPREKVNIYEQYLVNPDQYTTRGEVYHRKYRDHLIGIARISTEKYDLKVMKNSIGFYHDKKGKDAGKLYLGVDFMVDIGSNLADYPYGNAVEHLLKKHIGDFLYITQSCDTVFRENEITGSVIGMRWEHGGKNHLFNFWIEKKEADLFEKHRITLAELIERNTITNTAGQVIRLRK